MEKQHFEQAKLWLEGAEYIGGLGTEGSGKYAVGIAMSVHAIIKANDALTYKFMNTTARRHDDAARLFEDLVKKNVIKPEYVKYKSIIQEAINLKAKAEYRGAYFSKSDFDSLCKSAVKFVAMVESIV